MLLPLLLLSLLLTPWLRRYDMIRSAGGMSSPCTNNITAHATCKETKIPAYEQYNHHYGNSISGTGTVMIKDPTPDFSHEFDPVAHMGGFVGYKFVDEATGGAPKKGSSTGGLPMGNGAEARKTFHFFTPGYGAQVTSPATTQIRPMFIDVKNRWKNGEHGAMTNAAHPTRHGPVPKNSNVPPVRTMLLLLLLLFVQLLLVLLVLTSLLQSEMYSGMMECPCTDRYLKTFSTATTLEKGVCQDAKTKKSTVMTTAKECFAGAVSLGVTPAKQNLTINSMQAPPGCHATSVAGGFEVAFNTAKSKVACGSKGNGTRSVGHVVNKDIISFDADVNPAGDLVTITMECPAAAWCGVGFGSQTMDGVCVGACPPKPGTDAIISLPNGTVFEQELGMHAIGTRLPTLVTVVSHKVDGAKRTVVVTRALKGKTAAHYSFTGADAKIDFIMSVGNGAEFGYHKAKASGSIYFVDVAAPTCLCSVGYDEGTLGGFSFGGQRCSPRPLRQMTDDPAWRNAKGIGGVGNGSNWPSWNNNSVSTDNGGVNPTCSLKAYRGGLRCCHGGDFMVDSGPLLDEIMACNATDGKVASTGANCYDFFQLKYRYYYEDGKKPTGKAQKLPINTMTSSWWTEHGNNENDVPPCDPKRDNKDGKGCRFAINSNFSGSNWPIKKGFDLKWIHMLGHCHIGCQGMQLWNMTDPKKPYMFCNTSNDYGASDAVLDEQGWILGERPCIYGDPKDGFVEPPIVRSTDKIMSVKIQNNTNARYGDMGLWEIRGVYVPNKDCVGCEEHGAGSIHV